MVAKLALFLVATAAIVAVALAATYRYLDNQAARRHEKDMLRERRDAAALTGEDDWIDRELEAERDD